MTAIIPWKRAMTARYRVSVSLCPCFSLSASCSMAWSAVFLAWTAFMLFLRVRGSRSFARAEEREAMNRRKCEARNGARE